MVCKGQDQPCIWFALINAEYDEPNCKLDDNQHEIRVSIQGLRRIGRGNLHSYELILSEQGRPFCIDITQKTSRAAYHSGNYKKSGFINSDETLDIIFLVKKASSCLSNSHQIILTCTLKHMHPGIKSLCTTVHKVSLVLTVV